MLRDHIGALSCLRYRCSNPIMHNRFVYVESARVLRVYVGQHDSRARGRASFAHEIRMLV